MSNDVVIQILDQVTPQMVEAFAQLIPQLSSSSPPPTAEELQAMVDAEANDVLVAVDLANGQLLGSLTLVTFRIPTGIRAWIEDVVVDAAARGRGVGEALNQFALDLARSKGAKTVDLTSRPTREAANRLYVRMGFQLRTSNLYRFDLISD